MGRHPIMGFSEMIMLIKTTPVGEKIRRDLLRALQPVFTIPGEPKDEERRVKEKFLPACLDQSRGGNADSLTSTVPY